MTAEQRFLEAVEASLAEFFDSRERALREISSEASTLIDAVRAFTKGGKRARGAFVYWGWRAVSGHSPAPQSGSDHPAPASSVGIAVAIELFHAAALVHDDIIDASDTRRGAPSMHRSLESAHRAAEWAGDPAGFGRNAGILVGDLLLNWADDRVNVACGSDESGPAVLDEYRRMREEVTFGQYLDVLEEVAWIRQDPDTLLERAHTVATTKSARYSVERPLRLGALLAGADDRQLAALSGYGLAVGLAFQMRDDLLGVFGDPEVTGKPAGDDLREGKRTVLIELARQRLAPGVRTMLDELLGDPGLDEYQIEALRGALRDAGAPERVEALIDRLLGEALESLHEGAFERGAVLELERLAHVNARRNR